jgi:quercetin dioxygenase-like cupin family protein
MAKMKAMPGVDPGKPIDRSPSLLPIQHLVSSSSGSTSVYVGQQWLQPGDRVLDHTHPVEEGLFFLSGSGVAKLGDTHIEIGPNASLLIPAEVVHGFSNSGDEVMRVVIVFPTPDFAATKIVETNPASPVGGRDSMALGDNADK